MLVLGPPTSDATELQTIAQAVRDEAGWFITAQGEINGDAYQQRAAAASSGPGQGRRHALQWQVLCHPRGARVDEGTVVTRRVLRRAATLATSTAASNLAPAASACRFQEL